MSVEFSQQFHRVNGEDDHDAKKALLKQLKGNFPKSVTKWIKDDSVHVERTKVSPHEIDWQHREEWAATHEPGTVNDVRKSIKHGHDKPIVGVARPGKDNIMVADGHHHLEAYTQLDVKKMPAYLIKVNRVNGPWDTMHEHQKRPNG